VAIGPAERNVKGSRVAKRSEKVKMGQRESNSDVGQTNEEKVLRGDRQRKTLANARKVFSRREKVIQDKDYVEDKG